MIYSGLVNGNRLLQFFIGRYYRASVKKLINIRVETKSVWKQNPCGNKIRGGNKNPYGNKIRGEIKIRVEIKSVWKQNPREK